MLSVQWSVGPEKTSYRMFDIFIYIYIFERELLYYYFYFYLKKNPSCGTQRNVHGFRAEALNIRRIGQDSFGLANNGVCECVFVSGVRIFVCVSRGKSSDSVMTGNFG